MTKETESKTCRCLSSVDHAPKVESFPRPTGLSHRLRERVRRTESVVSAACMSVNRSVLCDRTNSFDSGSQLAHGADKSSPTLCNMNAAGQPMVPSRTKRASTESVRFFFLLGLSLPLAILLIVAACFNGTHDMLLTSRRPGSS